MRKILSFLLIGGFITVSNASDIILPMGTIFNGYLINGFKLTAISTDQNPMPILIELNLTNPGKIDPDIAKEMNGTMKRLKIDMKDYTTIPSCKVLAFASIRESDAIARVDRITCVYHDGAIYTGKFEGYFINNQFNLGFNSIPVNESKLSLSVNKGTKVYIAATNQIKLTQIK
jgi:hypothetical protein